MTAMNMLSSANPVRELCDFLKIYPPWSYRMENVLSTDKELKSFDLVRAKGKVTDTIRKHSVIHVENVVGIGLSIVDTNEIFTLS